MKLTDEYFVISCFKRRVKSMALPRFMVLVLGLLCITNRSFAQNQDLLDSLNQLIEKTTDRGIRFEIFNKLSELTVYNDPIQSLEYASSALDIADISPQKARAHYAIGTAYWSKGDMMKSLISLTEAEQLNHGISNPDLSALIFNRIGTIYSSVEDEFKAISYYREGQYYFDNVKNDFVKFAIYNNLGRSMMKLSLLDSALFYYDEAIIVADEVSERFKPLILFNIAEVHFLAGNDSSCQEYLDRCETFSVKYNNTRTSIRVAQLSAELAILDGDYEKALHLADTALSTALGTQVNELMAIAYKTYSNVLIEQGQFDEAIKAINLSKAYFDSIKNIRVNKRLSMYTLSQSESEKQIIVEQNKIAELRAQNNLVIAAIFVVIAILLTVTIIIF